MVTLIFVFVGNWYEEMIQEYKESWYVKHSLLCWVWISSFLAHHYFIVMDILAWKLISIKSIDLLVDTWMCTMCGGPTFCVEPRNCITRLVWRECLQTRHPWVLHWLIWGHGSVIQTIIFWNAWEMGCATKILPPEVKTFDQEHPNWPFLTPHL